MSLSASVKSRKSISPYIYRVETFKSGSLSTKGSLANAEKPGAILQTIQIAFSLLAFLKHV